MAQGDLVGYDVEMIGLEDQLRRMRGADALIDKELTQAMTQSVLTLEARIKPLTPVFRGRLRGSIGSQVRREGVGSIVGIVGSSLNEVYPAVMEFGRRPGAAGPPSGALERWAHLVLGDGRLAYVVARSIHRKGIKGRQFMKRGFEAGKGAINQFFAHALERIAQGLSNGRT
jgi:hypothetical protein